jgi:tetratricopeptide (TPR) repeat protein
MSFLETGLEKVAAVCVGSAAMALGAPPTGAMEASVAAAALIGFFLGGSQKFGPECKRVREHLQSEILESYGHLISGSDGNHSVQSDLIAAHEALNEGLERCVIDRGALAASAVTREGFPDRAAIIIMAGLGEAYPDLFSADLSGTLPYRFAQDVVRAGIKAAVEDENYYRQLEPQLMFQMANVLGIVREDVVEIKKTVQDIRTSYPEVALLQEQLHATESDLIALLAVILEKRIPRENLVSALEQSYERLKELRENKGDLQSLANEVPEIASLLEQADEALTSGEHFSLDAAEEALAEADKRYMKIIVEREETVKRDKENRARILGKRAELAALKFSYAKAVEYYRAQSVLLFEALGEAHPDTATSYNNLASNLDDQGRYGEAEPLYRKALELLQAALGAAHPGTAASYNNLAYNLDAQGRYGEAEPLYRKALELQQAALGEAHPDTATSYNNLASNLDAQGRYGEAEPLFRKALEIVEQTLGHDHPTTETFRGNLAEFLKKTGRSGI